ncbi:MAG: DUF4105 domain-containing protein, partial [Polyangiaceae bacterium]
ISLGILFLSQRAGAAEPLDSVMQLAELEHLADREEWRGLGHYRETLFSGEESEVDGAEFFLSPHGKKDRHAELAATLEAFFAPVDLMHQDTHAICRFPARFEWLDEELALSAQLKKPHCQALTKYISDLDAETITYVYTSNYLKNPASAFGHTFLRIKRKDKTVSRAKDWTVEFTALTDTKNPFLYAFKGLTGLFHAKFTLRSFASKIIQYSDIQVRDLWEYDLALRPSEVRRFTLHVWELAQTHIDYTYLSGNCSYYLLDLLDASAPRLDLLSKIKPVVFPVDTVTALFEANGLVTKIEYFPSARNRKMAAAYGPAIRPDKAPELGHGPVRFDFGAGGGTQFQEAFTTIGFRLALHDLSDPAAGEPELSAVQFLDTRLRFSETHRSLTLDEMTFAELFALNPFGKFEKLLSFRVRGYAERIHDHSCTTGDCIAHGADFAVGLTFATHGERFAVFAMADVSTLFSTAFDGIGGSFVRVATGPFAGIRARVGRAISLVVTGNVSYLPAEHLASTFDVRASLRAGLTKNVALGVQVRAAPLGVDGALESYIYF